MTKRRKRKAPYKSVEHKQALLEHEKWLRGRGITPSTGTKSSLRGVPIEATLDFRKPSLPPTSDHVPGYVLSPLRRIID